jgi:tetratricopeptide (TPR) repeat protein
MIMSGKIKELENKLELVTDPTERIDLLNSLASELKLSNPHRGLEIAIQANKLSQEPAYPRGLASSCCYIGANLYYMSEFHKAVDEFEKALGIFNEANDKKGQALALNWLGSTYFRLGNYPIALKNHLKGSQLEKELNDAKGEASSFHNIGNIYFTLGDYEISLEYFIRSMKIDEEMADEDGVALSLCCIGLVYQALGDYQKALDYHLKADEIFERTGDRTGKMISVNNLGDLYCELKEHEKALESYRESLKISEELQEQFIRGNSLHGIGKIYRDLKDNEKALEYLQKGLNITRELGDKETEQAILISLGKFYKERGNLEESFKYFQQVLSIAEDIKSKPKMAETYQELSGIYQQKGEHQQALDFYQKFHETDKELFNENSDKKRQTMMIKFQVEQTEKEAEIYRLRNVELAEANRVISEAKEEIEEKNRHITSSIEYARRIQQAVLPPRDRMGMALPEHFVLFKPRDIVSGDFYWYSQTEDWNLVAVVDCTGHGVPGAFMSMIGSMLLNVIVNENGVRSPAEILGRMHEEVRTALKQKGEEGEATDGMDVCLCGISREWKRLVFAGAKRPLYLVRNKELIEIAGDSKSVGGRQKEEKRIFRDKQMDLRSGDMLYLSSDGYSDQCNVEGQKMGSRRLKELMMEVSEKSPVEQREFLLTELERHQGAEEQRDDIAVIGVRIINV